VARVDEDVVATHVQAHCLTGGAALVRIKDQLLGIGRLEERSNKGAHKKEKNKRRL